MINRGLRWGQRYRVQTKDPSAVAPGLIRVDGDGSVDGGRIRVPDSR